MRTYEIRDRSGLDNLDGSGPSRAYMYLAEMTLVDALCVAQGLGRTVDVMDGPDYVITYSGACPVWWLPGTTGADSHDLSSLGWCHTCLDERGLYIHHLPLDYELAVLTETATTDRVLRRQIEADGQTARQYAEATAGQAIAKDGYDTLAVRVVAGGAFWGPAGLMRQYTVHMKDARTVVRVAVPYDNRPAQYTGGARGFWAARDLAEQQAHDRPGRPRRCYDCHGTKGHASDCSWTRTREQLLEYPELILPGDAEEYALEGTR